MSITDQSGRFSKTTVAIGLTFLAALVEPAAAAVGWFTQACTTFPPPT